MPNFFCNIGNILRNVTNPNPPTTNPNPNQNHNNNNNNNSSSNNTHNNHTHSNEDNTNPSTDNVPQHQDYERVPHMPRVHIHPLEEFFAQAQQAAAAAFYANVPFNEFNRPVETQPHPPASTRAIRQLPTVSVTPEDLVDENNRECCICFEEHKIRDKVSRLPCAHIYHPQCIVQWLVKNNTCPQCRYELPTDNVVYERGRMERMKARKPRFAKYELQRMHNKELKDLCVRLGLNCFGIMEKKEYIDLIWNSGKVDVINAPDPVEYGSIADLRNMGVGVLKKNMGDAGVFFDPRDVIEKEDMVQIFVNSGRIVFKHDDKSELQHHDDDERDGHQETMDYGHAPRTDDIGSNETMDACESTQDAMQDLSDAANENQVHESTANSEDLPNQGDLPSLDETFQNVCESMEDEPIPADAINNTTEDSIPKRPRIHLSSDEDETGTIQQGSESSRTISPHGSTTNHTDVFNSNRAPHFAERTISQLRQLAEELQVDISNCIEKQDIINALATANR